MMPTYEDGQLVRVINHLAMHEHIGRVERTTRRPMPISGHLVRVHVIIDDQTYEFGPEELEAVEVHAVLGHVGGGHTVYKCRKCGRVELIGPSGMVIDHGDERALHVFATAEDVYRS